jgi:hypothetical protein
MKAAPLATARVADARSRSPRNAPKTPTAERRHKPGNCGRAAVLRRKNNSAMK